MNRPITGTLAILAMLTVTASVPAQLQTPYGPVGMPAPPQMMSPQMSGAGYGQLPPQAAMQQAMMQQAMMQQAMMQQAMMQQSMMQQSMMQQSMMQQSMMQPATAPRMMAGGSPGMAMPPGAPAGLQLASHSTCDSCDSSGCDATGCNSCGNGSLLGRLQSALHGGGLFGRGCHNGACGLGSLFKHCNSCGIAGCDQFCSGAGGCCLPRWFDAHVEWMYWTRDTSDSLALSSLGTTSSTIALNTNELDYDHSSGYRVTGAYLVAPSTALEVTYFGGFNWQDSATADSANGQLFSVFSNFGLDPAGGYPETGNGIRHSVAMSSDLNNGELNLRHRFVSNNCHFHSSLLAGVRYFRLREDLVYNTWTTNAVTAAPNMNYQLKTDNDLLGLQTGGDFYVCLTPRFKIGAEAKAGVYGTHSKQRTLVITDSPALRELDSVSDVAFLGDAAAVLLYRVTPRLTLRGGYQLLYVDGVATGVNNFNTADPFTIRQTFVDNDGDFFAHGANAGFEWTW